MPVINQLARFAKTVKTIAKMKRMEGATARANKAARARLKSTVRDVQINPRPNELPGVAAERAKRANNTSKERAGLAVGGAVAGGFSGYAVSRLKRRNK